MNHIHILTDPASLSSTLQAHVFAQSHRVVFVIDAQTSRASVSANYLQMVNDEVRKLSLKKYSVACIVGSRFDLLATVSTRASKLFADCSVYCVQLSAGALQASRTAPCYCVLIHGPQQTLAVPSSIELLRVRARSSEQTRLRCLSKSCQFRSESERPGSDQPTAANEDLGACLGIC